MSRPFEKLRALVIEDEPLVAMFIEDLLIEMGHEIGATVAQPAVRSVLPRPGRSASRSSM